MKVDTHKIKALCKLLNLNTWQAVEQFATEHHAPDLATLQTKLFEQLRQKAIAQTLNK